ncbi:uncharacterized protein LOC141665773 [Apium graveolens]|uniref:uncharacterized protein LOC141665773 n=1 Tax=Apium graveolens TaxID=4045 RepID=UPI003D7BBE7C
MSSQKVGSIKVPKFDKENYNLWKKKMILYLKAANPDYMEILNDGPHIPEMVDPDNERHTIPNLKSDWTTKEKQLVALDDSLQLILIDSMDFDTCHQILVCESGKQMWDTIELLMEGTEDVRENRLDMLTTQYEAFRSLPGEGVTSVYERLNRLLNEMSLHGKKYAQHEINRKVLLTLPSHLDNMVETIRERVDFKTMKLEKVYGRMKTHEMDKHGDLDITVEKAKSQTNVLFEAEVDDGNLTGDPSDYYTMEELKQMEDPIMENLAGMFSNMRFRRKKGFRGSGSSSRGQRSNSYSSFGYKTGMVDIKKFKCYNCDEVGHFSSECRKPQQSKDKGKRVQKRDSGKSKKYPIKSYIAEEKSWDDTDDEEEEYGNLALMAESTPQVSISPPAKISDNANYRPNVECSDKLCAENYNVLRLRYRTCCLSLRCSEGTASDLKKELEKIKIENDKLVLTNVSIEDLKTRNQYLELRDKKHVDTIEGKDEKIKELETKLQAYANSANLAKELISSQVVSGKLGIGLDYDELRKSSKKHVGDNEPVIKVINPPDTPHVLKNAKKPLFKKASSEPFNEENLFIHHEMLVEDLEKIKDKNAKKSDKQASPESEQTTAGLGFSSTTKSSKNRNGRTGKDGPRKVCNNCGSTGHLSHACKKVKVDKVKNVNMHTMPSVPKSSKCDKTACMSCVVSFMKTYLDYTHSHNACHDHDNHMHKDKSKSKTTSPPSARKEATFTKTKSKANGPSKGIKDTVNDNVKHVESVKNVKKSARYAYVPKYPGPNMDEAPDMIIDHIKKIEVEDGVPVRCIRSDNGTEFKNAKLNDFCVEKGISRQYSAPRTTQKNEVVERKNRTLVEAARTMLNEANLPTYFWAEGVSTTCYTQNRTLINRMYEKTPYELMANKKPYVKYFHVFEEK